MNEKFGFDLHGYKFYYKECNGKEFLEFLNLKNHHSQDSIGIVLDETDDAGGTGRLIYYTKDDIVCYNKQDGYFERPRTKQTPWANLHRMRGIIHRISGPAVINTNTENMVYYYKYGLRYKNREAWFADLAYEEKQEAIWSFDDEGKN